jgi:hypothetical protein
MFATTSPTPEALAAYEDRLKEAHASTEQAKTALDFAIDDVQAARDEARALFGTPEATSSFNETLGDLQLAARVAANALRKLPAIDERATAEGGDMREETS